MTKRKTSILQCEYENGEEAQLVSAHVCKDTARHGGGGARFIRFFYCNELTIEKQLTVETLFIGFN
jgi:hypothetical protein